MIMPLRAYLVSALLCALCLPQPRVLSADHQLRVLLLTGIGSLADGAPQSIGLLQNFPNPFNPATTIRYALPEAAVVRLAVFNAVGQRVADLVDETQAAGYHEVRFDGSTFSSGVYFYRLQVRPLDPAVWFRSPNPAKRRNPRAGDSARCGIPWNRNRHRA
jgi:hypothetical protein